MATLEAHFGQRGSPGYTVGITGPSGNTQREVIPAVALVNSDGSDVTVSGIPMPTLSAGTDRSGSATTTSGVFSVPANASRKALVGQNVGANNIGFNEFGGTAAIGSAGTYTVVPGAGFSISTRNLVNFIAATGATNVTLTEY